MKIETKTESYNRRRYGKPWIATVNFSENSKGDFNFGEWVGSIGNDGILIIDASIGEIIATGQKDHRGNKSTVEYSVVTVDGLEYLGDKNDAYEYFYNKKSSEPDIDALRKEKEELLARIKEIDAIIEKQK
jgi:hypothetical protein